MALGVVAVSLRHGRLDSRSPPSVNGTCCEESQPAAPKGLGPWALGQGSEGVRRGPKGRRREGLSVFDPHVVMGGEGVITRKDECEVHD
jgi:hypothetical protein